MKRIPLILLFAVAGVIAACSPGSTASPATSPAIDQPSIDTSSAAPSEEMSAAPSDEASPSS